MSFIFCIQALLKLPYLSEKSSSENTKWHRIKTGSWNALWYNSNLLDIVILNVMCQRINQLNHALYFYCSLRNKIFSFSCSWSELILEYLISSNFCVSLGKCYCRHKVSISQSAPCECRCCSFRTATPVWILCGCRGDVLSTSPPFRGFVLILCGALPLQKRKCQKCRQWTES